MTCLDESLTTCRHDQFEEKHEVTSELMGCRFEPDLCCVLNSARSAQPKSRGAEGIDWWDDYYSDQVCHLSQLSIGIVIESKYREQRIYRRICLKERF